MQSLGRGPVRVPAGYGAWHLRVAFCFESEWKGSQGESLRTKSRERRANAVREIEICLETFLKLSHRISEGTEGHIFLEFGGLILSISLIDKISGT